MALARGMPFVAVNHLEAHALTARLPGLVAGRRAVPLSAAAGVRRALPVRRGRGRRRATTAWAAPSTTRSARRSTRSASCSAWAGPAARRWSGWRRAAIRRAIALPRPMLGRPGCDFSFSGLKTAVAQLVATLPPAARCRRSDAADIAAGFQRGGRRCAGRPRGPCDGDVARPARRASCWWSPAGVAANAAMRAALAGAAAAPRLPAGRPARCGCAATTR